MLIKTRCQFPEDLRLSDSLERLLIFTLIPVITNVAGGIIAAFRSPREALRISVQHIAAGVVFAAVGVELLPELVRELAISPLVLGISAGVALMLLVKAWTGRLEKGGSGGGNYGPDGLFIASGVDVFIDGLLIGIGFEVGFREGVIITMALTIELLFLAISVASSMSKRNAGKLRIIVSSVVLALLVLSGALLGGTLLHGNKGGGLEGIIAFATATLLYLVTEELLVEAHEGRDTSFRTAMFFVGFVSILILESLTP
jgi:ZIP family zinc transporter